MASEGEFPKSDGDVLYSKDVNLSLALSKATVAIHLKSWIKKGDYSD